jgi:hypothetical protein
LCKNNLATRYATDATKASLHSADPGSTGANEISGGSPAYAKKTLTWSSASGGSVSTSATFDVAAGTTVAGAGLWDVSNAFLDGGTISSIAFSSQGTYGLTVTYTQT